MSEKYLNLGESVFWVSERIKFWVRHKDLGNEFRGFSPVYISNPYSNKANIIYLFKVSSPIIECSF